MGWGLDTARRCDLLAAALSHVQKFPAADYHLVDGPAALRSMASGNRPAFGIGKMAYSHYKRRAKVADELGTVVIMFDRSDKMPAARAEVAKARARAAASTKAPSESDARAATIYRLGVHSDTKKEITWQEMFSTSKTKAIAFQLIIKSIKLAVINSANPDDPQTVIIQSPISSEPLWIFPFGTRHGIESLLTTSQYGEAEGQIAMLVNFIGRKAKETGAPIPVINVHTIDTDSILQVGISPTSGSKYSNVNIVIAKRYAVTNIAGPHRPDQICLSAITARRQLVAASEHAKKFQLPEPKESRVWEVVSCSDIGNEIIPGGKNRKASALFWFLCAGGVDYCKGLSRFGWPQDHMVSKGLDRHVSIIHKIEGTRNEWSFDITELATILKSTRTKTKKDTNLKEFCMELNNLIYCLRYYLWQGCDKTPCAGPCVVSYVWTGNAETKTITAWLRRVAESGPKVLTLRDDSDF